MRLVWVLLIAGLGVSAQTSSRNPFAGDGQAIEAGRATFRVYCSPCHGIRGQGGRGPDLTRGMFSHGDRDADLFRVVSEGVPGTEMPAFTAASDESGAWRLVAYIRSIARHEPPPALGDAAAGEKLFWGKGGCGGCHQVAGRGRHFGPDLTRAGRQRSLAYLRESIVDPSADLTPGYFTLTVVTRDGQNIVGVQKGFDNFTAQLVDSAGNFHSFERAAVASVKREYRSLMPDAYGRLFSPAELNDLLAYLAGLRGPEVLR